MKSRTLLDTVYIIRLFGSGLFKKVIEKMEVHLVPAVLAEIKSSRKMELENHIAEGSVHLEVISEKCRKIIIKLIKRHKGKNQAINYTKGKFSYISDLGEFEIMGIVKIRKNIDFKVLTFDKKAKKMMRREPQVKPSLVPENEEQELLGFTNDEMKNFRRGYV